MFPSFNDLFKEFVAKFQEARPDVDPSVKGSWTYAVGRGVAAVGYVLVILSKELLKQFNPVTATGPFLKLWASYDDITQLGASPSIGSINVYGLNTTVIPADTFWAGVLNGFLYTNTVGSTISEQDVDVTPVTVTTLTFAGSTVTAVCSFPHSLQLDSWVAISGADQSDYNGNFQITPDGSDLFIFTYQISGTPVTPATGSPYAAAPIRKLTSLTWLADVVTAITQFEHGFVDQQYVFISNTDNASFEGHVLITLVDSLTFTYEIVGDPGSITEFGIVRSVHAIVNVQSETNGPDTAIDINGTLAIQSPGITGADDIATTPGGLQGGADEETDDSLRARLLLSRASQAGVFTNDQITLAALLINGNTDVYIQNPDSTDASDPNPVLPGQVKMYILRRGDPLGPIPTGGILEITKLSVLTFGKLPADVWVDDVIVLPPELLDVDFALTNVLPDTATMKQAIRTQLIAYFVDSADLGVDLDNDILRAVIKETQDLNSGIPENSFITSFDYTNVVETVGNNQLPTLGTLTIDGIPIV